MANRLLTILRATKKHFSRHLLFIIAAGLLLGLFAGVSQVRTILQQALSAAAGGFGLWDIVFLAGLFCCGAFFVGSALAVIPWNLPLPANPTLAGLLKGCRWVADLLTSLVQKGLGRLAARRYATGLPLAAAGILMFVLGAQPGGGRWFPLSGAICKNFATLFTVVGFAVLFAAKALLPLPGPPQTPREKCSVACCRYLAWLILCVLVGESIWVVDGLLGFGSYPVFTLWAFAQVGMILVVGASLIDYLHFLTNVPVRLLALFVAVGLMWYSQSPVRIGRPSAQPPGEVETKTRWYRHLSDRLKSMDAQKLPGPAVIVVASGGGSRAALFTSLVLEKLSREEMSIPSPGVLPETAARGKTWAEHILLISSVSGGSLATGHYVLRGGRPSKDLDRMRTTSKEDLQQALKASFKDWIGRLKDSDPDRELRKAAVAVQSRLDSVTYSEFFDDMGTDFMGPVLRGTLTPVLARSTALSSFWTNRFGWGASCRLTGYTHKDSGTAYIAARDPAVLFNTTDADKGTRVIVGFPPLPRELLNCDFELLSGSERQPREIGELSPSLDLTLAEAVRLSANFPWGFQIARVDTAAGGTLHLLDGGVVDNGGLDSVNYVLRGVAKAAKAKEAAAEELMALLKERGVLVVEIDSGAKPSYASSTGPLAWLTEPSRALSNSAFTSADLSRDFHKKALQEILRPEGKRRRNAAGAGLEPVLWALLRCNHWDPDTDVMTSWALGPDDKATILTRFLVEWEQWDRKKLQEEAEELRKAQGAVTAAVALEAGREQKAMLKVELDKATPSPTDRENKVEQALGAIEQQLKELARAKAVATDEMKAPIDTVLKTLEDGRKALSGAKKGDEASLRRAVEGWNVETPLKELRVTIDTSQQRVADLREQRQQTIQKSADFFQKQEKLK